MMVEGRSGDPGSSLGLALYAPDRRSLPNNDGSLPLVDLVEIASDVLLDTLGDLLVGEGVGGRSRSWSRPRPGW